MSTLLLDEGTLHRRDQASTRTVESCVAGSIAIYSRFGSLTLPRTCTIPLGLDKHFWPTLQKQRPARRREECRDFAQEESWLMCPHRRDFGCIEHSALA
mmetsp:Transcript_24520/g.56161  ORF Transcript_24520/g.56161 Transcript_24520/m.56161 type:complete len:99 (-) Transcript_24520:120-416(-)